MIIKDNSKISIKLPITNSDCETLNTLITGFIIKNYKDKLKYIKAEIEDVIQDCWLDFITSVNRKFKEDDIISYGFLVTSCKFTVCKKFKVAFLKKNIINTTSISLDDKIEYVEDNQNFNNKIYETLSCTPKDNVEITKNGFNKILNIFEKKSNTNKIYAQSSSYIKYLFAYYTEDKINYYGNEKFDSLDLDWTDVKTDESNLFNIIAQKLGYKNSSDSSFRFLKSFVKNTLLKNNVNLEDVLY